MDTIYLDNLTNEAKRAYSAGLIRKSIELFSEMIEYEITKSEGFYGLGLIKYNQKDYQNSLTCFRNSLKTDPKKANSYYYIGKILLLSNNMEEAQQALQSALILNSSHKGAKKLLMTKFSQYSSEKSEFTNLDEYNNVLDDNANLYSTLLRKNSPQSRHALSLIRDLECEIKPTINSHLGHILSKSFSRLTGIIMPLIGVSVFCLFLFPRLSNTSNPDSLISGIFFINISLLCLYMLICLLLGIYSAKNTRYIFDKGFILIIKGALTIKQYRIEMHRIDKVMVLQDWYTQMTGDTTLVIQFDGKTYYCIGIGKYRKATQIQNMLSDASILIRSERIEPVLTPL